MVHQEGSIGLCIRNNKVFCSPFTLHADGEWDEKTSSPSPLRGLSSVGAMPIALERSCNVMFSPESVSLHFWSQYKGHSYSQGLIHHKRTKGDNLSLGQEEGMGKCDNWH